MRTVVFINSHSRRAARSLPMIRKFFSKQTQFQIVDFVVVEDLQTMKLAIQRLQSHKRISCIIIGGGDGTIMTILNTLKNRKNIIYGFLPLGTSNVFVRNLGLPIGLKNSLQILKNHTVHRVNLGSVNGVLFANAIDVGLSVQVVKQENNRSKRRFGPLAYYFLALRILPRFRPLQCEIQVGHDVMKFNTYDLAVVNGRYYGPVKVNKAGSVYDDNLNIVCYTNPSRFGFLRDTHSFVVGRQYKRRNIFMLSTSQLTLKTKSPQDIQADGEIVSTTPAEIKIIKNAIRVLAPLEKP